MLVTVRSSRGEDEVAWKRTILEFAHHTHKTTPRVVLRFRLQNKQDMDSFRDSVCVISRRDKVNSRVSEEKKETQLVYIVHWSNCPPN